jgi:predicted O-methyltransferase YrrM
MDLDLSFRTKLLPTQPILREYFEGSQESYIEAIYEALARYDGFRLPTDEFDIETSAEFPLVSMVSNLVVLQLLRLLILLKRPKRILEIGTFVGVSTMYMASVLPPDGQIVTIEKFDKFAAHARRNFERNNLSNRIQLIQGDAFEVLNGPECAQPFDMVFLDGNKEKYDAYFELLDPALPVGGLFIVDDVFFQGDALNPVPRSEKGRGARLCMEKAGAARNYAKALLPLGDGVLLMFKQTI